MSDATKADLDRPYEPREVEDRWYAFWEKEGVFEATDSATDTRPAYVVPMPPPVTFGGGIGTTYAGRVSVALSVASKTPSFSQNAYQRSSTSRGSYGRSRSALVASLMPRT